MTKQDLRGYDCRRIDYSIAAASFIMNNYSSLLTNGCSIAATLLGALLFLTGCGTYPVKVTRGPMPSPSSHRQGLLAVAAFKDTRSVTNRVAIGLATGGFGNRLGDFVVKGGKPIETIMQSFFEDALRQVGYEIVPTNQASVVVDGEVFESWLTSGLNCVDRIGVLVRLRDRERGAILWEKEIRGQEDDMMSYNNAVRAAVDVTLANAIREFSSLDFYEAVQRRNRRALEQ